MADSTSKTLKCVFALDEDGAKTWTLSLKDPKDDLSLAAVSSVMEGAVTKDIFTVDDENPAAFLEAYIETVTKTYLT